MILYEKSFTTKEDWAILSSGHLAIFNFLIVISITNRPITQSPILYVLRG